jgi:signal transduction histidine kinase
MYRLPIYYTLLFLLLTLVSSAQAPTNIDSLWNEYNHSTATEDKLSNLEALSTAYFYNNLDSSILLLKEIKTLAKESNNTKALAKYYRIYGLTHHMKSDHKLALITIDTAIQLCRKIGDSILVAQNLINKGAIYQQSGASNNAIKVHSQVINMLPGEEAKEKGLLAKAYHNTGINYLELGLHKEALEHFFMALTLKLEAKEQDPIALLNTYGSIANVYLAREEYERSLGFSIKATEWAAKSQSSYHQVLVNLSLVTNYVKLNRAATADSLLTITQPIVTAVNIPLLNTLYKIGEAEVAITLNQFDKAKEVLTECRVLSREYDLPTSESEALLLLSDVSCQQKKYEDAINYSLNAATIAERHHIIEDITKAQQQLSKLYELEGDHKRALFAYKKYKSFQDSIFSAENSKAIAGLQAKHDVADYKLELANKDKELESFKSEYKNWYLLSLGLVALLLTSILVILYCNYVKQKNVKKELSQINEELYDANERLEVAYLEVASTNQQLIIANNKIKSFAAGATHELRESLRNIIAYSQLVSKKIAGTADADQIQGYLNQITASGQGLRVLLRNLVEYLEKPSGVDQIEELNVQSIIHAVKSKFKEQTDHHDFKLVYASTFPTLTATATHIEQIYTNLIDNAIKYQNKDVPLEIVVGIDTVKESDVFYVQDNGIGIDEAYHHQIFHPFSRLHGRHIRGSGMGLSIVKQLVEQYGGKVWLESKPNQGTKILFTLPAAIKSPVETIN